MVPTVMYYCLPIIGQFVQKTKSRQFSSVQLRRSEHALRQE